MSTTVQVGHLADVRAFEVSGSDVERGRLIAAFAGGEAWQRPGPSGESWELSLDWSFSQANWVGLPLLVVDVITSFLDFRSLGRMSFVCRTWRDAITKKTPRNARVMQLGQEKHLREEAAKKRLKDRRRHEQEKLYRGRRLAVCYRECGIWVLCLAIPALFQLAIGLTGIVFFRWWLPTVSTVPQCEVEALLLKLVIVVGSFFVVNATVLVVLFASQLLDFVYVPVAFVVLNTLGVLSNAILLGCSAAGVAGSISCSPLFPELAFRLHAFFSSTLTVSSVQLLLGLLAAFVFRSYYSRILWGLAYHERQF
jgi:hypothetical protein